MTDTSSEQSTQQPPQRVECPATRDPAVRLFIAAGILLGFGIWCLTDLRAVPEAWDLRHINDVGGYLLNNWGPFLFFPAGLLLLGWGIVFLHRVLVADDEGIGYRGKRKIAWDQVKRLDASELQSKRILTLEYGNDEQMKLDAWKLQNFRDLVSVVERNVPDQKQTTEPAD